MLRHSYINLIIAGCGGDVCPVNDTACTTRAIERAKVFLPAVAFVRLIVNPKELEFCDVARAKNKNRSRWVCPPCRDRIALELKCRMYEVRSEVYIIFVVILPKR